MIKLFIFSVSLLVCLSGCVTPSKELQKESNEDVKKFFEKYETDFDPADYDDDIKNDIEKDINSREIERSVRKDNVEPEIISGFRIQILMTSNIDEANQLKADLSSKLTNDYVYLIYEAPYYKVRVGDFIERTTANQTLQSLIDMGYNSSWVVPDKVYKIPPPKINPSNTNFENE